MTGENDSCVSGGKMKKYIIIIALLVLCASGFANSFRPNLMMPSLVNMNKISMHHSMSFMSGVSSNNQSFYQSKYTNHIKYQFNPKLSLNLDLNFLNAGTVTFNKGFDIEGNNDNTTMVLPEFSLRYQPTENTFITIEYKQVGGYGSSSFHRNWWE